MVLLYLISSLLQGSLNYVSLNNNVFYQPILNATSSKTNLISNINNLVIVSYKAFSDGFYLVNINNNSGTDSAVVILQDVKGTYTVIMGPGTTFNINGAVGLPNDLISYLNSKGLNNAAH